MKTVTVTVPLDEWHRFLRWMAQAHEHHLLEEEKNKEDPETSDDEPEDEEPAYVDHRVVQSLSNVKFTRVEFDPSTPENS